MMQKNIEEFTRLQQYMLLFEKDSPAYKSKTMARLARAKEQAKQPTVADGKQHRTHSKGMGDMEL